MAPDDIRVERTSSVDASWTATSGGQVMGRATAWVRPDDRCALRVRADDDAVRARLVEAVIAALPHELLVNVAGADERTTEEYLALGFRVVRRETIYAVSVARAVGALSTADCLPVVDLVSIAEVEEDRLRLLDDRLRQDVPGTAGWRWKAEDFHEETYAPYMDPAVYLVGVERATGAYVAIARAWMPRGRPPRLGFVGVVPELRRAGLARALFRRIFDVLAARGVDEVSGEVDVENRASNALMARIGATPTAESLELALPARAEDIAD